MDINVPIVIVHCRGPTRKETRQSEAASYLALAKENGFFGIFPTKWNGDGQNGEGEGGEYECEEHIHLEKRAMDSFQNVLFCLTDYAARYGGGRRELGLGLEHVTIVSHGFKRERFMGDHVKRVGWDADGTRTTFVGLDPEYMGSEGEAEKRRAEQAKKGELQRGLLPWKEDESGGGEILRRKRQLRNIWGVGQGVCESEEVRVRTGVKVYVSDDGEELLVPGEPQPWSRSSKRD